jgi:hypothetical protein
LQKDGAAPTLLYAGAKLRTPFDIDVALSKDASNAILYIADLTAGEAGSGAVITVPVHGGELAEEAVGWSPRGVSVGPDGRVYFSGRHPESAKPGVFTLDEGGVSEVFSGAPLVDPSGVAVFKDGRVAVLDTRLFDQNGDEASAQTFHTEAGVVLIEDGRATITGRIPFTGYPAGLALTEHETTLIASGLSANRSNTVYLLSTIDPLSEPVAVAAPGGNYDSAAGLHRMPGTNTFAWADSSAQGGAVYRIRAAAEL